MFLAAGAASGAGAGCRKRGEGGVPSAPAVAMVAEARVKRADAPDDPGAAGWSTEVFHDAAASQLEKIQAALEAPATLAATDDARFASLLEPGFRCDALRPGPRDEVFRDPSLTVVRADGGAEPDDERAVGAFAGAVALAAQLRAVAEPFAGAADVHAKFKIYRIKPAGAQVVTVANFQMRGVGKSGAIQLTAIWHLRWRQGGSGAPPLLEWIHASAHEESTAHTPNATLFSDWTESVMGRNPSYREQLSFGIDYWLERMDASFEVVATGPQGLAIGDVNGDGLDDLYVAQQGGLPNRLFVQQPDGTALDTSAEAGVDLHDRTTSALFLDLDSDGDQDLIVATQPAILLYENDGAGRFSLRGRLPATSVMSLAAADYDLDGDLDLYTCEYFPDPAMARDLPTPSPFFDANNGSPNILYRNDGGWKFTDVTSAVGLDQNNHRWSFAASFEDYDDDGDPDLYVANDFGRNNLYRNDHGRFTDVAAAAGVEDPGSGMSVSWGDENQDGRMDLYVGNMWSSAGGRISTQERFKEGASPEVRRALQRFAKGSSLFENAGDGTFRDVSERANVELGRWAWGSIFTDLNNDGREDLLTVNGFVSRPGKPDL